jgi:hypothetical protein
MLSYAYSGLADNEVLDAFKTLLALSPNDRGERYRVWFEGSQADIKPPEVASSISTAMQLDLTNAVQSQVLCAVYVLPTMHSNGVCVCVCVCVRACFEQKHRH